MKKLNAICIAACAIAMAATGTAKAQDADSLIVEQLYEAVVTGTKAPQNAPFAISRIDSRELGEFSREARELPYLFTHTPGVIAWGENGLGIGTTYMRIRGAGDSRINVTLDGVPLNSPEDQCVFWANMNSYSSFLGNVEIQRGVGSSSNGDGAFGGSVALMTAAPSYTPSAEFSAAYGSFNTRKMGESFSTGLMNGKWILNGAFNTTATDGYMHGTPGRSGSWMAGITYLASDRLLIRYHNIGNFEHTGQAWNGVDSGELLDGIYGEHSGIYGYSDLYRIGLGRFNSLSGYYVKNNDGAYDIFSYKNPFTGEDWVTTDNFVQDHNILSATWQMNEFWKASASLHYTYGAGFYEELRPSNKLSKFGLSNLTLSDGSTLKKTDFIRKKGLTQNTYGVVMNASRVSELLDLRLGLSAQNFDGWHYGYLTYVKNEELRARICPDGKDYMYYDSDARKTDASTFVKATLKITPYLRAFGDLQYRYVRYTTSGKNDKFVSDGNGGYNNQELNINESYNFLNPKAGLEFASGAHRAFASAAMSHREPERNNFTDNGSYPAPKPERLLDYEAGYNYTGEVLQFGATAYYMDYKDQFVQTGLISDIGEKLTTNIAKSYRTGIELTADVKASRWLDFNADAALSSNRILDFDEVVEDWDNGERTIHYDNSTLAFSPSAILGGGFDMHYKGARASWRTNYVSRQYLDNTQNDFRSLPAYTTTDVNLSYTFTPSVNWIKDMVFALHLGNIFNSHHACSGWVYSAICDSYGNPNESRYTEIGYIPSAGFNLLASYTIRF